ncbi:MAG: TetR/AcrR family transcriptional regulator [Gammaproteobacteria bacterium]|nr:TetR/AcrR family transcriptional regulator [Gammaproteobacteria bacterium]
MPNDTKDLILNAAEALFAEHGFGSTSLRKITTKAGVNLASVNYHFGSKEALINAVFERRIVPMNQQRIERLKGLQEDYSGRSIPLEVLIETFIGPAMALAADQGKGGAVFIRLLGRSYTEPSATLQQAIRGLYGPVIERFKLAFSQVLPELPPEEIYWRMHFMVGLLAYMMAGTDMMRLIASCQVCDPLDIPATVKRLSVFLSAGMGAPQRGGEIESR